MICPSCGQPLDATTLVCPHCGRAVENHAPSGPAAEATVSPWAPPERWEGRGDADDPTTRLPDGTDPATGAPADHEPTAELPTAGFGDPRQYLAATHQPPIRQYLPLSPTSPGGVPGLTAPGQPRKRRVALPILLLALALMVAGGGAAAAGYYLGWFGRGSQPSDLMPAATVAYAQIDLDPSLSQKSQAWAFLRDLPQVREAVAAGQPDPKRLIWQALSADEGITSGADYDTDVKPWLGDRIGFGVLAHGDQPAWVIVIQVTDEAVAAKKLRSWISSSHQDFDVSTRDGYAVVTAHEYTDFVSGELTKGSLGNSRTFRSDVAALGDTGVFAAWADLGALARQRAFSGAGDATMQGRLVFALRFTSDTLALDGRFFAAGPAARVDSGAGMIGALPESTGFALSISGGADALNGIGSALPGGLSTPLAGSGLDQADLEALFGRNLTIAAPTSTLTMATDASASAAPAAGVRITTDDVGRARAALHKLAVVEDAGAQIFDQVDGDVLTAATTRDYLAELLHPAAALSGNGSFTKAVPDHAKAAAAMYVNLTPLLTTGADFGEYGDFGKSLQGFGTEVVPDGAGGGSWSVRLVRS